MTVLALWGPENVNDEYVTWPLASVNCTPQHSTHQTTRCTNNPQFS